MVEDGVAPSIFGLIERGIAREPELAAQMRGRVVFRFAEDFSPLRIHFRPRSVVVEDGDSRNPDLVIERQPARTSSTSRRCRPCAAACTAFRTRAGRAVAGRSGGSPSGRVRIEGNRVLGAAAAAAARGLALRPASAARSISSRTPKPLGPLPTYSRPTSQAVPAMSRWAQGFSSTNSSRKEAA